MARMRWQQMHMKRQSTYQWPCRRRGRESEGESAGLDGCEAGDRCTRESEQAMNRERKYLKIYIRARVARLSDQPHALHHDLSFEAPRRRHRPAPQRLRHVQRAPHARRRVGTRLVPPRRARRARQCSCSRCERSWRTRRARRLTSASSEAARRARLAVPDNRRRRREVHPPTHQLPARRRATRARSRCESGEGKRPGHNARGRPRRPRLA